MLHYSSKPSDHTHYPFVERLPCGSHLQPRKLVTKPRYLVSVSKKDSGLSGVGSYLASSLQLLVGANGETRNRESRLHNMLPTYLVTLKHVNRMLALNQPPFVESIQGVPVPMPESAR